jgi:hypothetical protein
MRHCDPRPRACNRDRNQSPRIGAGVGAVKVWATVVTVAPNGGVAMASPLNRPGVQSRGRVAAFPTSKVGAPPVGGGPWRPNPGAHFASKSGLLASKPGGPLSICIMQMISFGQSAKFARAGRSPGRPHPGTRRGAVLTADRGQCQAIFCRRRHQPRRAPLAKIRPGKPAPAMGAGTAAGGTVTDGCPVGRFGHLKSSSGAYRGAHSP